MKPKYILTDKAKELIAKGIDVTPKRGTPQSAGMDLCACIDEPLTLYPKEKTKIYTGLKIFLGSIEQPNYELAGFYLPRSSNEGLILRNTVGLLDCDYQGESFLKVININEEDIITIYPGDKIAQLVIFQTLMSPWEEVFDFELTTERAEGGDGSTGGTYKVDNLSANEGWITQEEAVSLIREVLGTEPFLQEAIQLLQKLSSKVGYGTLLYRLIDVQNIMSKTIMYPYDSE